MLTHITAEEKEKLEQVRSRIHQYDSSRGNLIPGLQTVQEIMGYLPAEAVELVADFFGVSPAEVFGVASFYNQFRLNPPGKYPIKVCMGTACHVRGGDIILENFERKLEISEGETTEDREFSLERVACVGCCALAPVTLVGEAVHGYMSPSKVEGIFTQIQVQKDIEAKKTQ